MYPFKPFYNDWLDCSFLLEARGDAELPVNLTIEFFDSLKFDQVSLKKYRIEAAIECAKMLGDNPALCISGGVDSQSMLQAWIEAGLKFKTYILVFNDNLNVQDVSHARMYCKKNNITLNEYHLNVTSFLTRNNWDIGMKYQSSSPQFNTHYYFFDILKEMGHTGICTGGQTPIYNKGVWGENFNRNSFNFITYSRISNFPCQGSFLSFYPKLCWAAGLLSPEITINKGTAEYQDLLEINAMRYESKVKGYRNTGFNIIPQNKKYTGFEFVKSHFEEKTGDGWAFEKKFRIPLEKHFRGNMFRNKFKLSKEVLDKLELIYRNNVRSSFFT